MSSYKKRMVNYKAALAPKATASCATAATASATAATASAATVSAATVSATTSKLANKGSFMKEAARLNIPPVSSYLRAIKKTAQDDFMRSSRYGVTYDGPQIIEEEPYSEDDYYEEDEDDDYE